MFERYTEKARRVIFFARYEASQFGSPYIETEHVLLGLLREDKALTHRFLRAASAVDVLRQQIEARTTVREKVSTSVDLPLSNESKRVLAYAAEEAERLGHKHIGTEHLFLGLLCEEKSFAAELLHAHGLQLSAVREQLARAGHSYVIESPKPWDIANVTITSMPPGADIEVDNAFLGHTPAHVSLEVGERNVAITKTGYKPWQRRLKILPGSKQTIAAELEQIAQ
jgi:ATP-dependent Clp protease ATP-binding subunit ClpA